MLRYGITLLFTALSWSSNVGTFITNILGSFVMGLLVGCFSQSPWLLMATVGLCGGFTTFSTFSMQSVSLFQSGKYGLAILYMAATAILCVLFAALGWWLGHRVSC